MYILLPEVHRQILHLHTNTTSITIGTAVAGDHVGCESLVVVDTIDAYPKVNSIILPRSFCTVLLAQWGESSCFPIQQATKIIRGV